MVTTKTGDTPIFLRNELHPVAGIESVCGTDITTCKQIAISGSGMETTLEYPMVKKEVTETEIIPEKDLYDEVFDCIKSF